MTTTLITGANKGLGREVARRLLAEGHTVWIGARNPELGQAAADELGDGATFVQLDVTDDASVDAALTTIRAAGGLDRLINNAGIVGPQKSVDDITADDVAEVFATNVLGPVRLIHAFLPLLRESKDPAVVDVSSGLGSVVTATDPSDVASTVTSITYPSSKSALNMITAQYAKGLTDVRFNAVDPGYTATDLNGNSGHQTVTEGTDAIVALATAGPGSPTGTFTNREGVVPW
jgi:NAD(P)-dependent dehydrogenase (short-subunit alcohol dehydrogenase family)